MKFIKWGAKRAQRKSNNIVYYIIILVSIKITQDNPTIRRQDFRCAKGGRKRGEGIKRQTGTRMTECPYEVRVLRTDYGTWTVQVKEPSHNHELVEPSAFPYHRRPTEDQKTRIRSLHASGVAPRFIVASILEQTPESLISLRDVYNEIARGRKERRSNTN